MKLLAADIGTGTQDILLFDSQHPIENAIKMVLPSATAIVAQAVERATAARRPLLLTGVTMGGGPSSWAVEAHIAAGLPTYATPDAARTLDDDLERVREMGVHLVSEEEAANLRDVETVEMRDLDLTAIRRALAAFAVPADFDAIAVAVLDHGAAPPGVSDRAFRFEHLRRTVEDSADLRAFAYLPSELPDYLTRLASVARSASDEAPLLLMDSGPAAALGALQDERIRGEERKLIVNVGNMHTLGFDLEGDAVRALFEHHTGLITPQQLDHLVTHLADGSLTNEEVFGDHGHGCFVLQPGRGLTFLAATGPRRGMLREGALTPYFAAPHGDMMLTGCFGLLDACSRRFPQWRDEIVAALGL